MDLEGMVKASKKNKRKRTIVIIANTIALIHSFIVEFFFKLINYKEKEAIHFALSKNSKRPY
jgi:hypothetical protein